MMGWIGERADRAAALTRHNGQWWWDRRQRVADWCFALFTLPFSGLMMVVGITGELGLLSTPLTAFLSSLAEQRWWLLSMGALCFVVPGMLASAAMLWRRSHPRWLMLAGLLLLVLYGDPIPLMVGLYSYPAYFNDRKVFIGWLALSCLAHGLVFNASVAHYTLTGVFDLLIPTVAGLWIGTRRELVERLRERTERLEREQHLMAEQAITSERTRIAREMHDVVAHRVSLMVLHAGGLEV
ncbi:histidine kinase, partial [Nocardiopsis sp. JB363]|uniref:histidine kinase n=1 Tax=Nocardiopsis sp. JB363 TaxID=1434837 RepID=UPI00190E8B20